MSLSLNQLYKITGTSKQAFFQRKKRMWSKHEQYKQLEWLVSKVRKDHPGMCLRDLYLLVNPDCMGRDKFEQYFKELGYGVGQKRNKKRTTDSTGVKRFPNMIESIKLTSVNQVWVSDITYYRIGDKFYYLTFIMDQYSRRILGYSVSRTLRMADTTLPSLKMAVEQRGDVHLEGLIFHSDGGGQYYSTDFVKLTKAYGIRNSMGTTAIENPHAERLNGIVKNNYLRHYNPKTFAQLKVMTSKAVKMYNEAKPHKALSKMAPIPFEELFHKNQLIHKRKKVAKKEKYI